MNVASEWPYPRWIAHRGAGRLAPENTLAAIALGQRLGWRMFECDVTLSADGVPFLMHDERLTRTAGLDRAVAETDWETIAGLDAGSWHSPAFRAEHPPSLEAVLSLCAQLQLAVNLEIKPCPGREAATGLAVGELARLWRRPSTLPPPLLTSFSHEALQAARSVAPELPRGLLMEALSPDWQDIAQALGCVAIVAHQDLCTAQWLAEVHAQGWRALAYTVNDASRAQELIHNGVDGLITDAVDKLAPSAVR